MVGLDFRALPYGSTLSSMLAWFVQQLQSAGGLVPLGLERRRKIGGRRQEESLQLYVKGED